MKTIFIIIALTSSFLGSHTVFAGLEWNKGTLGNPDNLDRSTSAVAYDPNGSIYVSGYEETSTGARQIVTKKYSASGLLLYSTTNIYIAPVGTIMTDYVKSITLDASGNVYVLCGQFGSAARGEDIVVLKYNSSLNLQWKRYIYNDAYPNTNFDDVPCKLLIDATGNIYVAGRWYNASTPDDDQVVVRKMNSSGTTLFTTTLSESSTKKVSSVSDFCLDNASNLTIVANVNYNGVFKILYARINAAGTVQWTRYHDSQAGFNFTSFPEIECTSTGTFYISMGMTKLVQQPYTYVSKLNISLFALDGTNVWDRYTSQIDFYPTELTMRIDASDNIYFGTYYMGPQATGVNNFRIYKYNSSGSMLWTYLSSEAHNQFLDFELFGSSSLFAVHYDNVAGYTKLKKINAATGGLIWSENITVATPSGYVSTNIWPTDIAINMNTSEIAYCGYIRGSQGPPNFNNEQRWNVRKYGATSPRMANADNFGAASSTLISVFPNPASDYIQINFDSELIPDAITIYDVQGKLISRLIENLHTETTVDASHFPSGIVYIHFAFADGIEIRKVMITR